MLPILEIALLPLILLPLILFVLSVLTRIVKSHNYSRLLSSLGLVSQLILFVVSLFVAFSFYIHGELSLQLFTQFQHRNPLYQFHVHIDIFSVGLLVLSTFLSGVIGRFSLNYLAFEDGYYKFFMNFYLMQFALYTLILSTNFYFILIAWELLGIASVFLISFYQTQHKTVANALFVMGIYKFCDFFLILALLFFHHEQAGFLIHTEAQAASILFVSLLILASMGKSGIFPFSKWLPRAMEGPTTSSAIFYGALSIHAGVILLLKFRSLLVGNHIPVFLCLLGLMTVVYASLKSRIQTDVKSTLAYATVVQVGFMYIELGLGWHLLVLLHIVSNALLKTYQFIRSPSNLYDANYLESLHAQAFKPHGLHFEYILPKRVRIWLYKLVYHNFGLTLIWQKLLAPFQTMLVWVNDKVDASYAFLHQFRIMRMQSVVFSLGVTVLLVLIYFEQLHYVEPVWVSGLFLISALAFSCLSLSHKDIKHYLIKIKLSYFMVSVSAVLFFGSLAHYHSIAYFLLNLISLFILDYFIKYLSRRLDIHSLKTYLGIGSRYKYISMIAIAILLLLTFTPGFASFILFDAILEELSEQSMLMTSIFLSVNIVNMFSFYKFMFKILFGETITHLNQYPDFTPLERIKLAVLIVPMIMAGLLPFFIG